MHNQDKYLPPRFEPETRFQLAPYVRVGFRESKLYFGFGSIQQVVEDHKRQSDLLTLSSFLTSLKTKEETLSFCKSELNLDRQSGEELVKFFMDGCYLIGEDEFDKSNRFSRHSLYYSLCGARPRDVQERLKNKTVAILGCGGIGSLCAVTLATAGVQKFLLFDGDVIEISNLTRQFLFKQSDEGLLKVDVLKNALKERVEDVQVKVLPEMVGKENVESVLDGVDCVLLSADSPTCVQDVSRICRKLQIPVLNAGYVQDIAVWGPFYIPGKSSCLYCSQKLVNNEDLTENLAKMIKVINSRYQAPSTGPVNMMASSFASMDILKYLGDFGEIASLNKRVGLWTHDFHLEEEEVPINPDCRVCQDKEN